MISLSRRRACGGGGGGSGRNSSVSNDRIDKQRRSSPVVAAPLHRVIFILCIVYFTSDIFSTKKTLQKSLLNYRQLSKEADPTPTMAMSTLVFESTTSDVDVDNTTGTGTADKNRGDDDASNDNVPSNNYSWIELKIHFIAILSMQRSASSFLSHKALGGDLDHDNNSDCSSDTSMNECHHFVSLNEIFSQPHPQSGDAWEVEPGYSYLYSNRSTLEQQHKIWDLSGSDLYDVLGQVSQRRCMEKIVLQYDDEARGGENYSGSNNDVHENARKKEHHCFVNWKHFDIHLFNKMTKWNKTEDLLVNYLMNGKDGGNGITGDLAVIVLERNVTDRWKSKWVAKETGDWNVDGTEEHKKMISNLESEVPPVGVSFKNWQESWYKFLRDRLVPRVVLGNVPILDLTFENVTTTERKDMRDKVVDMILHRSGKEQTLSRQEGVSMESMIK